MGVIQLSGCALLAVAVILLLRSCRAELAPPARLAATVVLFGAAVALYHPVISEMRALLDLAEGGELATTVFRATGIALIAELTAEMKDAAKKLEFERAAYLRDKIKNLQTTV